MGRGKKAEVRGQKADVRCQMPEGRSWDEKNSIGRFFEKTIANGCGWWYNGVATQLHQQTKG